MWTYEEYPAQCRRLAGIAHERYMRDTSPLYLVGLKRDGRWLTAILSQEKAEGESYIIQEHIPRNLPRLSLEAWIQERLRREPVLTVAPSSAE